MAIEKKIFAGGGMDMDTDERFMPKTDYKKAVNCRISKTDEGNDGIVENIRSNALTNNNLIQAGDKCIGNYEDKSTGTVIFFIYAFDGNHGIYRKKSSGSIEKIVQDPILNFHQRYLITGINVVGSDEDKFPEGLLYWTDDYNPPRKINIEKARTNGYAAITAAVLDVIKWAPDIQPNVAPYLTDTNIESNQLKDKAWQFKYRWIYDDGEKSSWSPISKVSHDNSFDSFFNFTGTSSYSNNVLPIGFMAGYDTVHRIQIAGRNTNGIDDFILICDIDKHNVKEKVGTSATGISPIYNSTTPIPDGNNTWAYFYFYNDGIYSTIDAVESNKLYNDVPHLAKAQEIVDGNRLVYGNVVSGQTGLEDLDIELTPTHPASSIVAGSLGTTISLGAEYKAEMKFSDPGGVCAHDIYRNSSYFYVRWEIPEPGVGCITQYNIDLKNLKGTKFIRKNDNIAIGLVTAKKQEADVIIINVKDYISSSFNSQGAGSIASDIAADLQSNTSYWDVTGIKGEGSSPWTTVGASGGQGGVISSVSSKVWSSYVSGGTSYVQLKVSTGLGDCFRTDYNPTGLSFSHAQADLCRVDSATGWGGNGDAWTKTAWSSSDVNGTGIANTSFSCQALAALSLAPVFWRIAIGTSNSNEYGQINSSGTEIEFDIPGWGGIFSAGYKTFEVKTTQVSLVQDIYNDQSSSGNTSDYTEICPSAGAPPPILSSFKTGAKHRFGLVYYDKGNRSTSVQLASVSDTYIPKPNESSYTGEWEVEWKINHAPPDWATHYQWVYGGNTLTDKFLQFVTGGFYSGDLFKKDTGTAAEIRYVGNILVDITSLRRFNETESGSVVSYNWSEGDILRVLLDGADAPSSSNFEFKVLGIIGERDFKSIDFTGPATASAISTIENRDYLVLSNETAIQPLLDLTVTSNPALQDYTLEIYSPKKELEEEQMIYYEFGEFGNLNLGNGVHRHDRVIGDSTSTAQDITTGAAATGTFKKGDIFYKIRNSKSNKPFCVVESFHFSDTSKSDYWDKGRPNAVLEDFKRTRKHSTCLYSEPYIPNTNINGLSSFFPDVSFTEFERDYNSIQKLHSKDNKLIIFQEDKVSQSLVNRNIIYNIDGSGNVATSDSVLSQAVPYLGNYGINKNPESFAVYGNSMYFVDVQRGVVLRLANDGFTPISNYKMKNFFTDSFKAIQSLRGDNFHKIVGVYDSAFDEYVISQPGHWSYKAIQDKNGNVIFVKDNHLIEAYTVGFCESSNRWNSFYSYIPEMMCPFQNGFVSFDAGNLYVHNISGRYVNGQGNVKTYNTYNEFYGIEYDSELWVVSNEAPSNNKVYQSFSQESDKIWDVTFDSPNGQSTVLLPSDFDTRENIHYSDIMNDVNSAGGLIEGDRIRDVTLLAKLKLFSNKLTRIFGVNFNFAPSQRSNK